MAPPTEGFFPLVYEELRGLAAAKLSREPAGHSLNATALVHEVYLRLEGGKSFRERCQFLKAAAVAMQRILVDHARGKRAAKRGGGGRQFSLDEADREVTAEPDTLLDVAEALDRLAVEDPTSADVARFRLFTGLSIEEAAEAMGISRATAFREWSYARSWLTIALATIRSDESLPESNSLP